MKVKMKKYEKSCLDYTIRYKSWDYHACANDSYLNGYLQAKKDVLERLDACGLSIPKLIETVGLDVVEVTFEDGMHQLNARTEAKLREKCSCSDKTPFTEKK